MTPAPETPPPDAGDTSPVYQSLLETLEFLGIEYTSAMAMIMQGFVVTITFQWPQWLLTVPIGLAVFRVICWGDPLRLRKLVRYVTYRCYGRILRAG